MLNRIYISGRRARLQLIGLPPIPGIQSSEVKNGRLKLNLLVSPGDRQQFAITPLLNNFLEMSIIPIALVIWNNQKTRFTHSYYIEISKWKVSGFKVDLNEAESITFSAKCEVLQYFPDRAVRFINDGPLSIEVIQESLLEDEDPQTISRWMVVKSDGTEIFLRAYSYISRVETP